MRQANIPSPRITFASSPGVFAASMRMTIASPNVALTCDSSCSPSDVLSPLTDATKSETLRLASSGLMNGQCPTSFVWLSCRVYLPLTVAFARNDMRLAPDLTYMFGTSVSLIHVDVSNPVRSDDRRLSSILSTLILAITETPLMPSGT